MADINTSITIKDGKVYLQETITKKVIKEEDFINKLLSKESIWTGQLPDNCLGMHRNAGTTRYLIKSPEFIRCLYRPHGASTVSQSYFPGVGVFYIVSINTTPKVERVMTSIGLCPSFLRKEPFTENTNMIHVPLPNTYEYKLCVHQPDISSSSPTFIKVNEAVQLIENSFFNEDNASKLKSVYKAAYGEIFKDLLGRSNAANSSAEILANMDMSNIMHTDKYPEFLSKYIERLSSFKGGTPWTAI